MSENVTNVDQVKATQPQTGAGPADAGAGKPQDGGQKVPDAASIQAEFEAYRAKVASQLQELSQENAKYRKRNDEETKAALEAKKNAEAKLKEQGEYQKLLEAKEKEAADLQKQIEALAPKAQRYESIESKRKAALADAKASENLPSYVSKAIDLAEKAGDVEAAHEILDDYRRSRSTASSKEPALPAPAPGAAPTASQARKRIEEMSPSELRAFKTSDPAAFVAAVGGAPGDKTPNGNPYKNGFFSKF